jgi:hypothetical protein
MMMMLLSIDITSNGRMIKEISIGKKKNLKGGGPGKKCEQLI